MVKDIGALMTDPGRFAQCSIECAQVVLDAGTGAKAGVAASGAPVLRARGKLGGATRRTSIASRLFRALFRDRRFPRPVPAPTIGRGLGARTARVGAFAGRVVPIIGLASLFPDARALDQCVASCVRPSQ